MKKEALRDIIKKYQQGTCSEDEKKFVEKWYDTIDGGDDAFSQGITEHAMQQRYKTYFESRIHVNKQSHITWYSIGIAASILVFFAIVFYSKLETNSDNVISFSFPQVEEGMKYVVNYTTVEEVTILPDGSSISLQPNSKVCFNQSFKLGKREVYLEGEAYFDVARNPSRPFLVYTNEIVTEVLGTSFNIKAFPQDIDITVAVRTGNVAVYAFKKKDGNQLIHVNEMHLIPNQQVRYNRDQNNITKTLVEKPRQIIASLPIEKTTFYDTPVLQIINSLEEIYGIEIDIDEKKFSHCFLTTSISKGEIYDRLDIICQAIGATYSVEGIRIIIKGSGCN